MILVWWKTFGLTDSERGSSSPTNVPRAESLAEIGSLGGIVLSFHADQRHGLCSSLNIRYLATD